jgi:hypothetical protein
MGITFSRASLDTSPASAIVGNFHYCGMTIHCVNLQCLQRRQAFGVHHRILEFGRVLPQRTGINKKTQRQSETKLMEIVWWHDQRWLLALRFPTREFIPWTCSWRKMRTQLVSLAIGAVRNPGRGVASGRANKETWVYHSIYVRKSCMKYLVLSHLLSDVYTRKKRKCI